MDRQKLIDKMRRKLDRERAQCKHESMALLTNCPLDGATGRKMCPCGHQEPWPLDDGQKPLIRNNRAK